MKTYDIHFNNDHDSTNKGFKENLEYCMGWIRDNRTDKSTYFGDYVGGTVSIICNETGETVYEEGIGE